MNYKDTLQLPKTDFPMKADLVKREPEILKRWAAEDVYAQIQKAREGAPTCILHDGPPFANGDVHMGTALNKVLKDMVVKSHTMAGFSAPYLPGWDCHGLPIEFKVVRKRGDSDPVTIRKACEAMRASSSTSSARSSNASAFSATGTIRTSRSIKPMSRRTPPVRGHG